MEYEYKLNAAGGTLDVYEAEATMAIPTVGIGYVHPLSDTMFIGIQGGLLLVTGTIGYEERLWPGQGYGGHENFDTTVGFNGELSLSYMITQKVMLQAGYRYQTMKLKADFNAGAELDETDTVHGVVVSAVYMFDL
ncbi:MAG: outer membrane beta-barrel protein [Deltaproteobacteria bacterium]|nr:outer membrane beta-barrel protein [Deltaproteobacteria bacterium]